MRFCFDVATQSTTLEGATLEIESVAAEARCGECNQAVLMADGLPLCTCGSAQVSILSGQELLIQDVEGRLNMCGICGCAETMFDLGERAKVVVLSVTDAAS